MHCDSCFVPCRMWTSLDSSFWRTDMDTQVWQSPISWLCPSSMPLSKPLCPLEYSHLCIPTPQTCTFQNVISIREWCCCHNLGVILKITSMYTPSWKPPSTESCAFPLTHVYSLENLPRGLQTWLLTQSDGELFHMSRPQPKPIKSAFPVLDSRLCAF